MATPAAKGEKAQKSDKTAPPPPPPPPPPVPVIIPRTSVTYYYLALSGIFLGVILLIYYAVCFRQSTMLWTAISFVFGIAFGVIAIYKCIFEEGERLFLKISSSLPPPPPPAGAFPRPRLPPVVIEDVDGDEEY